MGLTLVTTGCVVALCVAPTLELDFAVSFLFAFTRLLATSESTDGERPLLAGAFLVEDWLPRSQGQYSDE